MQEVFFGFEWIEMYFLNFTIKDGQEIDRIFIHSLTSQKVDRLTVDG